MQSKPFHEEINREKQLRGPNVAHGPRVGQPSLMAMKTIICLSFIVVNNFFANMCVKKNCASPTKSLTARHWERHIETQKSWVK